MFVSVLGCTHCFLVNAASMAVLNQAIRCSKLFGPRYALPQTGHCDTYKVGLARQFYALLDR